MNIKYLYYIIGGSLFIIVYTYSKIDLLFLAIGSGIGLLLHDWLKDSSDNMVDKFYHNEKLKREQKKAELEAKIKELDKDVK